jgi:hypothetical protein
MEEGKKKKGSKKAELHSSCYPKTDPVFEP